MVVPRNRRAKWNSGFLAGHSDGRLDATLQRPPADLLLGHEDGPDQWGRGYLKGYEDGYNHGLRDLQRQG